MRRALELASGGVGSVEPNPPVGAVVVDSAGALLGEGRHERFGGPHAEIHALKSAGERSRDATLVVTLEPCRHSGKTGPCTDAVISAGVRRVVVGTVDPNPQMSGEGVARLRAAGIQVDVGVLRDECERLIAPFAKWITTGLPWVHAKWAMTLDGKIAARTGHSQWISNVTSRAVVHRLRGRMDAVIVGAETAATDDPLLTARPPGPRVAARAVVSRSGRLRPDSQLALTAGDGPVLVTAVAGCCIESVEVLRAAGVEILELPPAEAVAPSGARDADLLALLRVLGGRDAVHVLVEGGGRLLGAFLDAGLIDEFHVFIAPKLVGGSQSATPMGGLGRESISDRYDLENVSMDLLDGDVYIHGTRQRP
ncbi:MAG: bifunctional diaminohydroxyphosphoribosylaminopyrimidine deaminase/5-amino-6-(5-phosphoribosylamino)uracil reductase RibD [Planctomycetaceae bacterium]